MEKILTAEQIEERERVARCMEEVEAVCAKYGVAIIPTITAKALPKKAIETI